MQNLEQRLQAIETLVRPDRVLSAEFEELKLACLGLTVGTEDSETVLRRLDEFSQRVHVITGA